MNDMLALHLPQGLFHSTPLLGPVLTDVLFPLGLGLPYVTAAGVLVTAYGLLVAPWTPAPALPPRSG